MEEKFRKKVFYIEGEMEGYHVFTTPEPVIIELASKSLESHKQLPIRQVYHTEVFRAINHPEGILKSRQFKTFMGHSLDAGPDSAQKSLGKFEELTDKILNELKIKTKKIVKPTGFNLEYFYLCNEGDNLELGDDGEKTKSLSLAMAYHYAPNLKTWARFRDNTNKNSRVKYVTYGFGTQRALYSILDSNRDELGFNIPEVVRPFNLSIIPMNRGLTEKTQKLYDSFLEIKKRDILFDDRENLDWGEKAKFADYLGIPIKIIISPQEAILKSRGGIEIARFENLQSIESFIKSYK